MEILVEPIQRVTAVSQGRVNLIGEHTDYNGGFVLPTCIPQETRVRLLVRQDQQVLAHSLSRPDEPLCYELGNERATSSWGDYVQGVTATLIGMGARLSGFEIAVESRVPLGSGLSSSAALETSLLKALNAAFHLGLSPVQMALIGQRAENEFVGARVGIMDPLACCLGTWGEALFINTSNLNYERVPLALDEMDLIVIDSCIPHSHASGEFNRRRAQCEEACSILGVGALSEVSDLSGLEGLPDLLRRRARHVLNENARVVSAVECIRSRDFVRLGQLFNTSHVSMRDDYEVSVPEMDILVEIAQQQPEVWGARMTGGGFGGAMVAMGRAGTGTEVGLRIVSEFKRKMNIEASLLVPVI